jgi:hypothetical protein
MAIILKVGQRSSFSSYEDVLPDPMLLAAGDRVAVTDADHMGRLRAYEYVVDRTTEKQIVLVGSATRYYRETGAPVGGKNSRRLLHTGHPEVLAAKQAETLQRLKTKMAEVLGEKMTSSADRIRAARLVQVLSRQAFERVELYDAQMAESLAEMEAVKAAGRAES